MVTYADKNISRTDDMVRSAQQNGYRMKYYSFTRPDFASVWHHANFDKVNATKDRACSLPAAVILVASDAHDTIFMAPATVLKQTLAMLAQGRTDFILFAAERVCWPDADKAPSFADLGSPYRYLNAGGFVGNAGFICSLLQQHLRDDMLHRRFDDQRFWTSLFLSDVNHGRLLLDSTASIFHTMAEGGSSDLQLAWYDNGTGNLQAFVYNPVTRSTPVVFHANGDDKREKLAQLRRLRKAVQPQFH